MPEFAKTRPLLTLLPLAPKVFAPQKRFSATPTSFMENFTQ
jgi:hypothetical protein